MAKEVIVPNPDRKPNGFSPATKLGNMVFVSGHTGTGPDGKVAGPDCKTQTEQVFRNIEAALTAAGAKMTDVMKITCFLVNEADYPAYTAVRSQVFPNDPPASSSVIVKALVRPELLVEVEAVAVIS